jgi:hypothetical protein
VASEVGVARRIAGVSLTTAAARARVARSTWVRVEAGSPSIALGTLVSVVDAVGLDLVVRTYPSGGPRLRDHRQLEIAGDLARAAARAWRVELEALAGEHGQAIDVVLWGADEILAIEVERRMVDFQAQFRAASLKREWLAARHARPVRVVLAVEDTHRNRLAIAPHVFGIERAMSAGSRAVMGAIRSGARLGSDGLLWVRRR